MPTKLHELLAAERTRNEAWDILWKETLNKFKKPESYYEGYSKSLAMIDDNEQNQAKEAEAREEKPVTTSVYETLEYALDLYGKVEDFQLQKNSTNQRAVGTILWQDKPLLIDLPVDQLLGLESRLKKIRELFLAMPTLDASKHWQRTPDLGEHLWGLTYPEVTTKTDKQLIPVVMAPATEKHAAQVQPVQKDVVVGRFTTMKRSGAATAQQKADAIKTVDDLLVEVKKARMRANETEVLPANAASVLIDLLLKPLKAAA